MADESRVADLLHRFQKPQVRDTGGEAEGVAEHPDELLVNASLNILCKDTADLLVKHYPGFLWAVAPDERGGVLNIYCLNFSGEWGYTIRLLELQEDPKRREVIRAGGEILKRFRYPGTRFDPQAANNVKRLPNGEAIPDLSDMPASKNRAEAEAQLAIAEGRATVVTIDGETFLHVTEKKP